MKKKFVWNPARIFFHNTGTEKIEALAKEGWSVEKLQLGGLLFQLKEDEPREVKYHLTFHSIQNKDGDIPPIDEGWELIDALDYMQIFRADSETPPKEMHYDLLLEQLEQEGRLLGKYTILSAILLLLSFLLHIKVDWAFLQMIILGGIIMLLITFLLFLVLYALNKYRQHNLNNCNEIDTIEK